MTTIHTRQLQQFTQDNYNNIHKTTTTIHTRQLQQLTTKQLKIKHVRKVNNTQVTLSLTLPEESKLKVFQNRVMRISGPKRDEVTEVWRKLHNEELDYPHCSHNILFR